MTNKYKTSVSECQNCGYSDSYCTCEKEGGFSTSAIRSIVKREISQKAFIANHSFQKVGQFGKRAPRGLRPPKDQVRQEFVGHNTLKTYTNHNGQNNIGQVWSF